MVDSLFAQWLQQDCLWRVSEDAAAVARWGDGASTAERKTGIALRGDAAIEAERQLEFLGEGRPLVIDEHLLTGAWASLIGMVITVSGPELGYEGGVDVFLLGAADDHATGTSTVTVLRRL